MKKSVSVNGNIVGIWENIPKQESHSQEEQTEEQEESQIDEMEIPAA